MTVGLSEEPRDPAESLDDGHPSGLAGLYDRLVAVDRGRTVMTGRLLTNYFGREWIFDADDDLVVALEHVIRERLSSGLTMFFSATGDPVSGRQHATVVLTPQTFVSFSYTDLDDDPNLSPDLTATIEVLRLHVAKHGGICLDADDLPIEPI